MSYKVKKATSICMHSERVESLLAIKSSKNCSRNWVETTGGMATRRESDPTNRGRIGQIKENNSIYKDLATADSIA